MTRFDIAPLPPETPPPTGMLWAIAAVAILIAAAAVYLILRARKAKADAPAGKKPD